MCLFVIVINCRRMCAGGRVFTDYAVVFLHLRSELRLFAYFGGVTELVDRCCHQLSVSLQRKEVLSHRAGAQAVVSAAIHYGVQSTHLILPVFQRSQLPMWKICKSQRIQRWEGAVPIIIMLDSSICARLWGSLLFIPPLPLGTSKLLRFQPHTFKPDRAATHLL